MERLMDKVISKRLNMDSTKVIQNYNIFEQLVYSNHVKDHKLTTTDKIILVKLLENVEDKLEYDYPNQKLQIYMIIMFSNFIGEGIYLDLDEDYVNSIIKVLLQTNITKVLFTLL